MSDKTNNRYATTDAVRNEPIHEDILFLIKRSGGISKEQLKDELDYPNGEISKALISLQEAFLVYEDQIDTDWDTGWFNFETEWFELKHEVNQHVHHLSMVLLNYLDAMVFATFTQIKDWSELSVKELKQALEKLVNDGEIHTIAIDELGEGYIRKSDLLGFEEVKDLNNVFV